jgi:anti-sigma B factor antagonist
MRIQHRMVGDVAIIDLNGKLTLGDGDELLRDKVNRLIQQGQKRLVLNLADVPYMDSAGLGEVVRTYTAALNHRGGLKLLRPTKRVQDLLIITKIWTILEAFESEEDAVRSFPPSAGV